MENTTEIVEIEQDLDVLELTQEPPKVEITYQPEMISDENLMEVYAEILNQVREDRKDIDHLLSTFVEMVINEGDSTTASKEALVNLMKIKSDQSDKMSKVADMMTGIKAKEKAAMDKLRPTSSSLSDRRSLLDRISREQKRLKREQANEQ